ncbi:MAG TPA: hypothetical protein VKP65_02425 [Rhodothermales bacterium]|nr:hypothetical protein [Rhodothermales bacterium]
MAVNLLTFSDQEPPMGDTAGNQPLSFLRAIWATPLAGEDEAPAHRITHARVMQLHGPAILHRLGVRRAQGYHKCGSVLDQDWVTAFRVLIWNGSSWEVALHEQNLPCPEDNEPLWFDLNGITTSAALLEVRHCGIDEWWPSWNLTQGAFILEGEPQSPPAKKDERLLDVAEVSLSGLPPGLEVEHRHGEVRFRSRFMDVGFCLNRAGFSFLALDEEGQSQTTQNLLRHAPGLFFQGPHLHPVGSAPVISPALRNKVRGTSRVQGNRVTYTIDIEGTGQRYRLAWEVLPDRLMLRAERQGEEALRAWHSSVWNLALNSTVAPAHVIGATIRESETGLMPLPAWLHAPRFGSFKIEADAATEATFLRSDAFRHLDMTTAEIKLGELPQPEGDYLLPAGRYRAQIEWQLAQPEIPLQEHTPPEIARAVRNASLTAMTYRADTATLSNNGASMHCPICMDNWSATTTRLGALLPNVQAVDLLRDSLERWLDGGPGYTSGRLLQDGELHQAEDEYLMTGTACLLGLADFLEHTGTPDWLARYREPIRRQLDRMRARDLDGDGLIESPYRTGVSGTGQWSTCWFDVVSYGWKDAFSNALLYPALVKLADVLPRLEQPNLADGLRDWAKQLRAAYRPTFFNPETGWLAGWRCKEDKLHDYAFLAPNGAAVNGGLLDKDDARAIMERLWGETLRVNLPDPYLGLPGNLWHIPDEDLSDIMQGFPLGYYQNGGRTHSQSRHFVGALYRVGMLQEANYMLSRLCKGLADGTVYGGCRSGLDWRYWDGRPCGYEGLLTDQFGILAIALQQYGVTPDHQPAS